VAFRGGAHRYIDPRLNVNGMWSEHKGHITHLFRDYALEFLNRESQQEKPFVLLFTPNAPHFSTSGPSRPPARDLHPPDPAPGDEKLYESLTLHRPPNFNKRDLFDKPRWFQSRALLTPELIAMIDAFRRKQLQSLNALDLAIDSLLTALAAQGKLDDTLVFYLSDNGLFWGEHRSPGGKGAVYQEASRVPFAVRYPRLVKEPRVDMALLANIDVAPTIYELAGIPTPPEVDGRSLVPLLTGKNTPVRWREELLIEGWPAPERVEQGRAPYAAIHTGRYVYVETEGDKPELYDLTTDPYQIQNQVDNPAYAPVVTDLKARLRHMQAAPPAVLQR
jgi:arylsulfatase A-like enzyme